MHPLISCLMVTQAQPQRFGILQKSIRAYQKQNYPSRELIILIERLPHLQIGYKLIQSYIADLNDSSIHLITLAKEHNLGELRNLSVLEAKGDLICQWDDDDLYHPDRLTEQYDCLSVSGLAANILSEVLLFNTQSKNLFYTNWKYTPSRGFPGSILAKKTIMPAYPEQGEQARLGEDSVVLDQLMMNNNVCTLPVKGYLYAYQNHDTNSWPSSHFEMLVRELSITKGLLDKKKDWLLTQLPQLDLGADSIHIQGRNGLAYVYLPKKS